MKPSWPTGPASLTLIRHAESVGNVADAEAHRRHAETLDLDLRDADVPLSDTGRGQAEALAEWLARLPQDERPSVVLSSPYRRAAETAQIATARTGPTVDVDERLRERDLGQFDGLTGLGIRSRFPEESERRHKIGKFYYTPPGGESWADVVLRVRSLLHDLAAAYADERVWLVTHQAVIMSHRYVLEGLDEATVLAISRDEALPNVSLSEFVREGEGYRPVCFGDTRVLDATETEVTDEPAKDERHPA